MLSDLTAWPSTALLSFTVVVCSVSTVTYWLIGVGSPAPGAWSERFRCGPQVYFADKVCAPLLFVATVAFFATGQGARPLPLPVKLVIPIAVAVFFLGSRYFELYWPHAQAAAACCHLMFRYIGFWWMYLALTPPPVEPLGFRFSFALDSLFYWGHIVYSVVRTGRNAQFQLGDEYLRGCFEVLLLIAVLYVFTVVVSGNTPG